jgi:hypothetical protein
MNIDKIANILGAIVTVALVTTIVQNGSAAAGVITAFGNAFSHSIAAAQGRGQ